MKESMRHKEDGTLIVGMGKTGFSVARFLEKRHLPFTLTDSRALPPYYQDLSAFVPETKMRVGAFKEQDFLAAHDIVLSPGVAIRTQQVQAAIDAGIPVCGDIELFARHVEPDKTVVAITGSNGKSTVTALVSEMVRQCSLAVATGGNFGTPALDLIDSEEPADIYVLELSSFQLETTYSLKPTVSVILNISDDHLDRYESREDYLRAKQRVHCHSRCVVVNRQGNFDTPIEPDTATISFGMDAASDGNFGLLNTDHKTYIARGDTAWIDCQELSHLRGIAGILNAQAALAIGTAIGLTKSAMLTVLRRFAGLPHRLQSVGVLSGVEWFNDSKATNVAAAVMAIDSMDCSCIWIAGGDGKSADFAPLAEVVNGKVSEAFLFGQDKQAIAEALRDTEVKLNLVDDLPAAMQAARTRARPGNCILFSPACASLDMYKNYIERGNHFVTIFESFTDA